MRRGGDSIPVFGGKRVRVDHVEAGCRRFRCFLQRRAIGRDDHRLDRETEGLPVTDGAHEIGEEPGLAGVGNIEENEPPPGEELCR